MVSTSPPLAIFGHNGYFFDKKVGMAGKSVRLDIGTVYKKEADGPYLFRYQVNG